MNLSRHIAYTLSTILLLFVSCKDTPQIDYTTLSAFTENGINAVIEIPAGTNHKIEFDGSAFKNDRIVKFLPYPGNYGYIPGTKMDKAKGGDGDALDILVIAEKVETGTVMEVKVIAALVLKDHGEWDTKIIAIPIDSSLQILPAKDFISLMTEYNAAQTIIKTWFLNYKGLGEMEFVAWQNERFAEAEIRKWME